MARSEKRKPLLLLYWGGGLERAGGIGRVVGNLLTAAKGRDLPYEIACIDTRGPHSIGVAPIYFALALARTLRLALSGRRMAAHVNLADRGSTLRKLMLCRLLVLLRIPYLLHLHAGNYDLFYDDLPAWAQAQVRRGFADAARVVVLGEAWRDLAIRRFGVAPEAIRIIRNGVIDPGRPERKPMQGAPIILMLGDLQPWKGMAEMIEALAMPDLRARRWQLVVAGTGEIARYRDLAERLGIAERIHFTGWVARDQVGQLLASAAMLALPSHLEGLSVTLVEALAAGVPVVATPVGAHPDILVDGHNALLVPPQDAPALALARLLDDPAGAAEIGRNGRHLFETSLNIVRIEQEFAALYAELWSDLAVYRFSTVETGRNPNKAS